MFKSKGLLSLVKALTVMLLVVALPTAALAQDASQARVKVNSGASGFEELLEELLLVKDGDNVTVIGLAESVPPQSTVEVEAGGVSFTKSASVFGQFPIDDATPVSFDPSVTGVVASITATRLNGTVISGTFSLDVTDASVLAAVEAKTTPVNTLLDIAAVNSDNQALVGQLLLSQKRQVQAGTESIIDQFEGIPGSVPPFSQIEIYQGAFDDSTLPPPGRLIRITLNENVQTDSNGDAIVDINGDPVLISNGSFFPFSLGDVNSGNVDTGSFNPVISMRITSTQSPAAFQPFWAQVTNDISASITTISVTQSPNGENNAVMNATVDPYSIVTVFSQNDTSGPVLAAGRAGADGSISINVPPAFINGFPVLQENVYVLVQDPFGNQNSPLEEVVIDDGTDTPTISSVVSVFPGGFLLTGTVESRARVRVWAVDTVPDTVPDTVASLPADAFFFTGLTVGADGSFTIKLPAGISRVVYLNALDSYGNESEYRVVDLRTVSAGGAPDLGGDWRLQIDSVTNNLPGGLNSFDVLSGSLFEVDEDGNESPTDGAVDVVIDGATVTAQVIVSAFLNAEVGIDVTFPFSNEMVTADADPAGTFSLNVPNFDPIDGEFVEEFFLVASAVLPDQSVFVLAFDRVVEADGLDRTGPQIVLAPVADDIELIERGKGSDDIMNIRRIFVSSLPADALPLIVVLSDGNDDRSIDVNDSNLSIVDVKPLNQLLYSQFLGGTLAPLPGASGLNLGENFWNPAAGASIGNSIVFVSLVDAVGNYSSNPIAVELDVETQDPDLSVITGSGTVVKGETGAVEAGAFVTLYENADKSGVLASTQANSVGAFFLGGLQLTKPSAYVAVTDSAGNESNAVKVPISNPVMEPQFVILDGFGLMHTPDGAFSSNISTSDSVVAMAGVEDITGAQLDSGSPLYVLNNDGAIIKIGSNGDAPLPSETFEAPGGFARDIEVISYSPFAGYVLMGNGVIVPFGDAPFLGDMVTMDPQGVERVRIPGSQVMFDDANSNGEYDTEDANGNGVLDQISIPSPPFVLTEDLNGNGELDQEALVDPANLGQGFFIDIARDLELVQNPDGAVVGYVILDGNGVLWTFGSGYGEEVITGITFTNGFSTDDIFRDLELVVQTSGDSTQLVDFVTMNGFGQVFGAPGGMLGAGPADDVENRGVLTGVLGAPGFNFDIARDLRISPADVNADGSVDYRDGFYILDGYGGIHALGGASAITESPFLGWDIARDLEFVTQSLR